MNDRYDAGYGGDAGYSGEEYELVGYDEYGRPVYRPVPAQQTPEQTYDAYGQQDYGQQNHPQQSYGYDPYATGGQQQGAPSGYGGYDTGQQAPVPAYDPYGAHTAQGTHTGYDPYGTAAPAAPYDPYGQNAGGQQPRPGGQTAHIPQQTGPAQHSGPPQPYAPAGTHGTADDDRTAAGTEGADRFGTDGADRFGDGRADDGPEEAGSGEPDYRTEQFAFVEEPTDDSEDVIDWLKFTENRTERREEARRRARSRVIALVVVLALVAVGGVGYLWYAGKLPGLSSGGSKTGAATAAGAQKRDVVVVHLHDTAKGGTSTALLVDNTTTKQGTTVLLPNSLALTGDDGTTTTLAKSVQDDGSSGTRDQLGAVLGTDIEGTWRLDTPYLQNLVDLVGDIEVDTDSDVPDPDAKKTGAAVLVHRGQDQTLSGKMAVAYATYRAPGESETAQLQRFGQVMQGVLRKLSSDPQAATVTVQTLAQILDPSLTDKDLGSFLAKLAELAKGGDYKSALLPVQPDGTLSAQTSDSVVKEILGGTAKSPDQGSAVRVSVRNASGVKDDTEKARVVLLNGGFTFLEGGTATTRSASQVLYADDEDKQNATEVAKTLGLPTGSVTKGTVTGNADVSVVLGRDYKPADGQ
ncbi:LCP family protein [Streptomyces sp. SID8499]|uniref:LytR C-terminal domain-containing protein n=1 Tax=Streptomyces sp. SID8499 TaxID=2706106 RepID=UPI0013C579AA|nr:LytR family transcriptional regulator [Streptomyces sp. SID8499]